MPRPDSRSTKNLGPLLAILTLCKTTKIKFSTLHKIRKLNSMCQRIAQNSPAKFYISASCTKNAWAFLRRHFHQKSPACIMHFDEQGKALYTANPTCRRNAPAWAQNTQRLDTAHAHTEAWGPPAAETPHIYSGYSIPYTIIYMWRFCTSYDDFHKVICSEPSYGLALFGLECTYASICV